MLKEERHMEKYKVILVDDEIEAIQAMEHKMDWDGLGFEVSGSATNGVKALELVENIQPDVVITDITWILGNVTRIPRHELPQTLDFSDFLPLFT